MKIIAVTFDYNGTHAYDTLARVLEHSAKKHCPDSDFELVRIPAPHVKTFKKCFDSNTVKLREWLRVLKSTTDDCVFMDCDMLILKDIKDAFDDSTFDIGYTIRDGRYVETLPMNGGMMFVRNNPAGVEFIEKWAEVNDMMHKDLIETQGRAIHSKWRSKYGGMNQAAFGYLTKSGKVKYSANLKPFKCSEWNACLEHWPFINESTRVLHVKSALRRAVLSSQSVSLISPQVRRATAVWRTYAAEIGLSPVNEDVVVVNPSVVRVQRRKPRIIPPRRSRYLRRWA